MPRRAHKRTAFALVGTLSQFPVSTVTQLFGATEWLLAELERYTTTSASVSGPLTTDALAWLHAWFDATAKVRIGDRCHENGPLLSTLTASSCHVFLRCSWWPLGRRTWERACCACSFSHRRRCCAGGFARTRPSSRMSTHSTRLLGTCAHSTSRRSSSPHPASFLFLSPCVRLRRDIPTSYDATNATLLLTMVRVDLQTAIGALGTPADPTRPTPSAVQALRRAAGRYPPPSDQACSPLLTTAERRMRTGIQTPYPTGLPWRQRRLRRSWTRPRWGQRTRHRSSDFQRRLWSCWHSRPRRGCPFAAAPTTLQRPPPLHGRERRALPRASKWWSTASRHWQRRLLGRPHIPSVVFGPSPARPARPAWRRRCGPLSPAFFWGA